MRHLTACALTAALLAAPGALFAFDLLECDADGTSGNSAVLLGWQAPTAATIGAIVEDDRGAIRAGISPANVLGAWEAVIADWESTSSQSYSVAAPRVQRAVSGAELAASITDAQAASTRFFVVVQADPTGGQPNGWSVLTGTDECSTLGVTLIRFDTGTRLIGDADIMINDDDECVANATSLLSFTGDSTHVHFQSVLLHEYGHFAGADHSDVTSATMFPALGFGTTFSLLADDRNVLRFLYATVPGPTPPSRNDLSLTACAVGSSGTIPAGDFFEGGGGWCSVDPTGTAGLYPMVMVVLLGAFKLRRRS